MTDVLHKLLFIVTLVRGGENIPFNADSKFLFIIIKN